MKKIYFLSGFSGKSHAGEWATQNGIFRLKIIYFEKQIAKSMGLEMNSKEETVTALKKLYLNEEQMINKFKDAVYDFMDTNKCEAISLESLYRANLATAFLNDDRFQTEVIYVNANLENRIEHAYQMAVQAGLTVSKQDLETKIKQKDADKIAKGVLDVEKIATIVLENNGHIDEYKEKILNIFNF